MLLSEQYRKLCNGCNVDLDCDVPTLDFVNKGVFSRRLESRVTTGVASQWFTRGGVAKQQAMVRPLKSLLQT